MSMSKFNDSLRNGVESLCLRRFFFTQSFSIYGGVAGLFDMGPPGCALKANMETQWRQHFVINENMLEVSCTNLTPEPVLKASGHVDRFSDLMVRNEQNPNELFRADKLVKEECFNRLKDPKLYGDEKNREQLEQWERLADGMDAQQLDKVLEQLGLKKKHNLSFPYPFNLMFKTTIGPQGNVTAYLRPETAQGIFVNFRRLLEQNGGKMPFAAAQLGLGFRNEIAPRQGLLRVREFPMAEIEHFVHPKRKEHPKFASVAHMKLPLFHRDEQVKDHGKPITDMTIGEAVKKGIVNNETLGYFMVRVFLYLTKVGLHPEHIRFRQHLSNEMAHYASDCWDAEAETTYGWMEIVGIADRAAFDLTTHTKHSKVELVAHAKLDAPVEVEEVEAQVAKAKLGPAFKKDAGAVLELLETMSDEDKEKCEAELAASGKAVVGGFTVNRDMVKFVRVRKTKHEETFIPSVVEPSFGMGRVLYCILEHSFRSRNMTGQEARTYLSLPPCVAPFKVSVLPLSGGNAQIDSQIVEMSESFGNRGISFKVDDSGTSIGKRYARTDEIGIPFGITVDFQSIEDRTVTLRERDSMDQIRLPLSEVVSVVEDLSSGRSAWAALLEKYPRFDSKDSRE